MYRTAVLTAMFVCVALGLSLAQDPTKVESSHYRVSFENDRVEAISGQLIVTSDASGTCVTATIPV